MPLFEVSSERPGRSSGSNPRPPPLTGPHINEKSTGEVCKCKKMALSALVYRRLISNYFTSIKERKMSTGIPPVPLNLTPEFHGTSSTETRSPDCPEPLVYSYKSFGIFPESSDPPFPWDPSDISSSPCDPVPESSETPGSPAGPRQGTPSPNPLIDPLVSWHLPHSPEGLPRVHWDP